jgi:polyisoprenyl-phosphate glycosyltransferase
MRTLETRVLRAQPALSGEVIFVDDGSEDGSFEELKAVQKEFPAIVTIIKLTRNFGQVRALLAGYNHARGHCVITMSADGQDPPEMINDMLEVFFKERYEIVICARSSRDESRYRAVTSRLFYSLMRKLTFQNMPEGGFDFCLMGRRALDAFIRNCDSYPFFQGQILWTGYKTKFLSYRRRERLAGISRWTFAKKFTYLLDGMLAYSFVPIRMISLAGCAFSVLGFAYAGIIAIDRLFLGNSVKGWAPLMIVVLVMGGFQMIMLGIIGEYLWRTLAQVRRRDMYLVEAVYEPPALKSNDGPDRSGENFNQGARDTPATI